MRSDSLFTCKIQSIITALHQLLAPIENPRYILRRESGWIFGIRKKNDYHAVPDEDVIGKRKEDTKLFAQKWTKAFDKVMEIYTRTPEGRSILVKSVFLDRL